MYSLRGKIIILPLRHFFNKYKNNEEDYEIVLEKYIKKSSTQNLVDFYLVNTKTLEVTDQQRDYWGFMK